MKSYTTRKHSRWVHQKRKVELLRTVFKEDVSPIWKQASHSFDSIKTRTDGWKHSDIVRQMKGLEMSEVEED